MVGTLSDITERKQSEEENGKLKNRLNQAQKMEAIGVLAGGIAHDFNNILAAIQGYTEMARDDAQPGSSVANDLDKVLIASRRAKDLVQQILAFSRQAAVARIPIQIQPMVKESLKMLRASIPTTISITTDIHPRCGTVLADPTQIHQIIMNLCTNAYHAMEATGGELSVKVRTASLVAPASADTSQIAPGEYVEVVVSDTGCGIGPDIIGKIFDPYFTTKGIGKGTGMGLSITHGIIQSYGGVITVESTLGLGTTFHVYLPVIQGEVKAVEEEHDTPRGKGRILFVDDEELLMEMGHDLLERLGYTVTARRSSFEALETYMNDPHQFDLVITDQTMPGMTGIDLARRMLQIRPDIPIILCTGYSHLVSEESAKAIGIREFAFKPLTKSSIGHLVEKVLNG
jgi:nitrogen-specific signal transduction histidine kinase/CheY-like chemotaxis protein